MKENQIQTEHKRRQQLAELEQRIADAITTDGVIEPIQGLRLARLSNPQEKIYGVSEPSFCVVARGSKKIYLGGNSYQYDTYNYLLATAELPIVSRAIEASVEEPYLGMQFCLDATVVASVMAEIGQLPVNNQKTFKAIDISPLNSNLLDATLRLIRLLDSPQEKEIILPLITREIIYRLLVGEQGHRLIQMIILDGHTQRISQAVQKISKELNQPLYIDKIAQEIGMSVSSFHHHFKEVTAMSPLQFQKQLRLQESQRLMIGENLNAATAGYIVGYKDASQFNREYKRFFGVTPMRDVQRQREITKISIDVVA